MAKIDAFFKLMHEQNASDLHLMAGQPPALRVHGDIERVKYKVMGNDDLRAMLYEIAAEDKIKVFEETGDVDFGYEIPGLARYRANFFMQKNGVAAVFREIPSTIMNCEQLGLPSVIAKLATLPRGLVIVTGPTGSGKSTTLAAIIDEANRLRRPYHHHRGPHRIRTQKPGMPGQSAGGGHAHQNLFRGPARRPARGPGHHPGG
jgi:twitching motility protein PilT